nr:MAG TPA: polynucleotide kinase [Bacteriophage sp.]
MNKFIICRGLPASGKSTWAKQWVLEDPEHRVRINQDDIRLMLGKYWVPSREKLVQEIQFDAIVEALCRKFDVVIDNTNLNKKVLEKFDRLIKTFEDYEIEYKDFFDTPLSVCIERDKNRELQVTEKVIRGFYNNYKDMYHLNGN